MENARVKAEILCKASGNALEQLLNIDYNRGKLNVFSGTSCDVESGIQPFMAISGALHLKSSRTILMS